EVRIRYALAVEVLRRLHRRIRRHVPVDLAAAAVGRADHPHRRALGKQAHGAEHAGGDAYLRAVGDDRLLRLAAAVGVDQVEVQPVWGEQAGILADLGEAALADAAPADRHRELALRAGSRGERGEAGEGEQGQRATLDHA